MKLFVAAPCVFYFFMVVVEGACSIICCLVWSQVTGVLHNQVHSGYCFSCCLRVHRDFGVDGAKTLWLKVVGPYSQFLKNFVKRQKKTSVFILVAIVLAFSWICIVETPRPFALCVSPVFKNIEATDNFLLLLKNCN